MDKEYYAFISYSHKDEEWAKWLQHEFEHYHLPTTLNGMTDVPDKFRPIFRDVDELSGGELKPQISDALRLSAYLVVICSPNSAKSPYVDGEIREFIEIGEQGGFNNVSNIFPFIIDGVPHSKENPDKECFPVSLRNLPSELIAGDVTRHGREHAFVKILSGTLYHSNVKFSMLWNQFERDRIETERKEREKRDKLLLLESRYLSEKAMDIAPVDSQLARLLVLRALPVDLSNPEDRPYCIEAESALRTICNYKSAIFKGHDGAVISFKLNSNGDKGLSASIDGTVRLWDTSTGSQIGAPLSGHTDSVLDATFSHNGKKIASCSKDCTIILWDTETGKQINTLSGASERINRIAFTHDDKQLIAISYDNTLRKWNVEDGHLISEISITNSNDMAIDSDDRWIALAGLSEFSIMIYDLKEMKMMKEISKAHSESLSSIDFSPDGSRVASGAPDGKIKVWEWKTGELVFSTNVGKVKGAYAENVHSVKYSSDGKFIVTASNNLIRIWDAVNGEQLGEPLIGHTSSVLSAYFSQDGRCILSSSSDRTARIWDLKTEKPYRVIGRSRNIPFESENLKSSLSPDGRLQLIVTPSKLKVKEVNSDIQIGPSLTFYDDFDRAMFLKDGTGIIAETENDYDVFYDWLPLQELIDKTREQVKTREFTPEERKKYYLD